MTSGRKVLLAFCVVFVLCTGYVNAEKEPVRVATYNLENFMRYFGQIQLPKRSQDTTQYYRDEEELYEIAYVIQSPKMDADILVFEESCTEDMLRYFNEKFLGSKYAFVKTFKGNTEGQNLAVMAKTGFEPLEIREFYQEEDPKPDPRLQRDRSEMDGNSNRLFPPGPGFILFKTPKGSTLWIGCTHTKSKSGNSLAVTEWRIREIQRTREICGQLIKEGKTPNLILLGDFNDDYGKDRFEEQAGTDAIAVMEQGQAEQSLVCLDKTYRDKNPQAASYHCKIKPATYRAFIDHAFASPALAGAMSDVYLAEESIAYVASDHLPLVVCLQLPEQETKSQSQAADKK